jgi:hypothetical protein
MPFVSQSISPTTGTAKQKLSAVKKDRRIRNFTAEFFPDVHIAGAVDILIKNVAHYYCHYPEPLGANPGCPGKES